VLPIASLQKKPKQTKNVLPIASLTRKKTTTTKLKVIQRNSGVVVSIAIYKL
jgi:hypothetical protein